MNEKIEIVRKQKKVDKIPEIDRPALKDKDLCSVELNNHYCTKVVGHSGDHVAHGIGSQIIKRWS